MGEPHNRERPISKGESVLPRGGMKFSYYREKNTKGLLLSGIGTRELSFGFSMGLPSTRRGKGIILTQTK